MNTIKNFLIETIVLTAAIVGWGILKLLRYVKAMAISGGNRES